MEVRLALEISHYRHEVVHVRQYQQDNIHYFYVWLWKPVTESFIMWLP